MNKSSYDTVSLRKHIGCPYSVLIMARKLFDKKWNISSLRGISSYIVGYSEEICVMVRRLRLRIPPSRSRACHPEAATCFIFEV